MPNRKRSHQITFRLNDEEYNAFRSRLESSTMRQEEYLRFLSLGQVINVLEGFPEAVQELKKIGVNVNQLARAVNGGRTNAAAETAELVKEVRELWRLLRQLKAGNLSGE